MNYYSETILRIKEYVSQKKFNQAYKLILKELSMPYIPKKYEEQFIELKKQVHSNLLILTDNKKLKTNFDKSTIFEIIHSKNNPLLPQALSQLQDLNLNTSINEVKEIFINENIKHSIKVIIFEYLVNQNIDELMIFKTPFEVKKLSTRKSLIMTNEYQMLMNQISNKLSNDPSLLEISKFYINQFFINLFPSKYIYENNDVFIFINIAEKAMGKNVVKLTSKKYHFIRKILKRYI